jgi:hypothetical protein
LRRRLLQLASIVVLLVTFGSHISELFDHWDHTLQTGNDIESVVVILALTAGAVLALAGTVVVAIAGTQNSTATLTIVRTCTGPPPLIATMHSPPPLALRI